MLCWLVGDSVYSVKRELIEIFHFSPLSFILTSDESETTMTTRRFFGCSNILMFTIEYAVKIGPFYTFFHLSSLKHLFVVQKISWKFKILIESMTSDDKHHQRRYKNTPPSFLTCNSARSVSHCDLSAWNRCHSCSIKCNIPGIVYCGTSLWAFPFASSILSFVPVLLVRFWPTPIFWAPLIEFSSMTTSVVLLLIIRITSELSHNQHSKAIRKFLSLHLTAIQYQMFYLCRRLWFLIEYFNYDTQQFA